MTHSGDEDRQTDVDQQVTGSLRPAGCLAVYQLGRVLNRVRFHIVQAWLLWSDQQARQVEVALNELSLLVRQLGLNCTTEDRLAAALGQLAADWRNGYGSEPHHEMLDGAEQDIRSRAATEDLTQLRLEHVRRLMHRWCLAVDHWQAMLDEVIDDEAQRLLRLGLHVDQGLHPWPLEEILCCGPSRGASADSPPTAAGEPTYLGQPISPPGDQAAVVSDGLPREPVNEYVAPELWFRELTQRWRSLEPLADESLPDFVGLPETYDLMRQIVDCLDHLVRGELSSADQLEEAALEQNEAELDEDEEVDEADANDSAATQDPEDVDSPEWESWEEHSYAGGRLIMVEVRLLIILNGERIPVEERAEFLFLKALADHLGNWISCPEIWREARELDGARCDRLKKRLDPRLQQLIEPKRGSGYRLRL
jgi:hypothetical protein